MTIQTSPAENRLEAKIPASMRAAIYRGVNQISVETVPVPEIGPGELLVKIATCGICGTDLKKIHTGSHSAPRIFGHEMAGTIVKVGLGVTQFALGERSRDDPPPHSLRRVLLLSQADLCPVPGLQKSRRNRGL
jgi:hypothetical protein